MNRTRCARSRKLVLLGLTCLLSACANTVDPLGERVDELSRKSAAMARQADRAARDAARAAAAADRAATDAHAAAVEAGEVAASASPATGSALIDPERRAERGAEARADGERARRAASREAAPRAPLTLGNVRVVDDERYSDMTFHHYGVNPTIDTAEQRVSTFSVDVDTASYSLTRSYLERGELPPEEAVRVEEFVKSFDYGYSAPADTAFAVHAEAAPSPTRPGDHLLLLGLEAREVPDAERKPANLVFVIDVSGSMDIENRLGAVKRALGFLVDRLRDDDRVGIVVYGTRGRALLEPTSAGNRRAILSAIEALRAEGSTNAQEGLELGYAMAERSFRSGAINRVVLCSDGVANNGVATTAESLFERVRERAARGVTLSTVGFGMGNYDDVLMERLAQLGDGNYAYVDDDTEARRIFQRELTGLLQVVARSVKVQVELDPRVVSRYRLLGYENRRLESADFANDRVDAGDVGASHGVTALYEIKLAEPHPAALGTVRIRHQPAEGGASTLIEKAIDGTVLRSRLMEASSPTRLAAIVAAFAEKLRGSYWARGVRYDELLARLEALEPALTRRSDVTELRRLVILARGLDRRDDRFESDAPRASMSFDEVPILE